MERWEGLERRGEAGREGPDLSGEDLVGDVELDFEGEMDRDLVGDPGRDLVGEAGRLVDDDAAGSSGSTGHLK